MTASNAGPAVPIIADGTYYGLDVYGGKASAPASRIRPRHGTAQQWADAEAAGRGLADGEIGIVDGDIVRGDGVTKVASLPRTGAGAFAALIKPTAIATTAAVATVGALNRYDATSGALAPAAPAAGAAGSWYEVTKTDTSTNAVTHGGETLSGQGDICQFISDGTTWISGGVRTTRANQSGTYVPLTRLNEIPTLEELSAFAPVGTISATGDVYLAPLALDQRIATLLLASSTAITASDTDYWTVQLLRLRAGLSSTIATRTTKTTGGAAVVAGQAWTFDLATFAASRFCARGDVLVLRFTKTGTPGPWTGAVASWRYEPGVLPVTSTLAADDFNRADSVSALGTTTAAGGFTWVQQRGTWGISSGQAYVSTHGSGRDYAVVDCGYSDVTVQATISANITTGGIAIRSSAAGDCLTANATALFTSAAPDTLTSILTFSQTFVDGDAMAIKAVGPNITVYRNGVSVGSVVNTLNQDVTLHGLRNSSGTAARFDNFSITIES